MALATYLTQNPTVGVGFSAGGPRDGHLDEGDGGLEATPIGPNVSREGGKEESVIVLPLPAAALAEGLPHVAAEVLRPCVVGVSRSKGGVVGRHFDAGLPGAGPVLRLVAVHGGP